MHVGHRRVEGRRDADRAEEETHVDGAREVLQRGEPDLVVRSVGIATLDVRHRDRRQRRLERNHRLRRRGWSRIVRRRQQREDRLGKRAQRSARLDRVRIVADIVRARQRNAALIKRRQYNLWILIIRRRTKIEQCINTFFWVLVFGF